MRATRRETLERIASEMHLSTEFLSKENLPAFLIIVLCVLLLNFSKLRPSLTLLLNFMIISAVFAILWRYTKRVDDSSLPFNFFGLKRSRSLIFAALGGYSTVCSLCVFGGVTLMLQNAYVPLPLRMPDTTLFAASLLMLLASFLSEDSSRKLPQIKKAASFGAALLLLIAWAETWAKVVGGIDVFRLTSSTYIIACWSLLLNVSMA